MINSVLEALGNLGVAFIIKGSDYCLKCATADLDTENGTGLEFMIQLYKVDEKTHMIDVKRTFGSPIIFIDLCDRLKTMVDKKLPALD